MEDKEIPKKLYDIDYDEALVTGMDVLIKYMTPILNEGGKYSKQDILDLLASTREEMVETLRLLLEDGSPEPSIPVEKMN